MPQTTTRASTRKRKKTKFFSPSSFSKNLLDDFDAALNRSNHKPLNDKRKKGRKGVTKVSKLSRKKQRGRLNIQQKKTKKRLNNSNNNDGIATREEREQTSRK